MISITDGQIYLQPDLFFAGVRPAMNAGISVSRVGGAAQVKAMKNVAGGLRLDLGGVSVNWKRLPSWERISTPVTQKNLDRGYRMVELLKQPQYQPLNVADQIMVIYAGTNGYLDEVPVGRCSPLGIVSSSSSSTPRSRRFGIQLDGQEQG